MVVLLVVLLAGLYFIGEAWAAAGWEGRPYRWTVDAISELGVPETRYAGGEPFAATHHVVMNATFVATGLRRGIAADGDVTVLRVAQVITNAALAPSSNRRESASRKLPAVGCAALSMSQLMLPSWSLPRSLPWLMYCR